MLPVIILLAYQVINLLNRLTQGKMSQPVTESITLEKA